MSVSCACVFLGVINEFDRLICSYYNKSTVVCKFELIINVNVYVFAVHRLSDSISMAVEDCILFLAIMSPDFDRCKWCYDGTYYTVMDVK